jgi:hypothetical protein
MRAYQYCQYFPSFLVHTVTDHMRIRQFPELLVIFFRTKTSPIRMEPTRNELDDPASESEHGRPSSPTPSTSASTTSYATQSITSSAPRKKATHNFLLFEYLLRFVHREGKVGDFARAGLLSLVQVAMGSVEDGAPPMEELDVSTSISKLALSASTHPGARDAKLALTGYLLDSDFADVLAAGLGALYGLLPNKLVVRAVGASSSPGKAASWDDVVDDGAGGMVLGGMGALGEDEDPDEAARKREDEEMRLRSLGVGISGTDEFREGLDGWLKLVEFMQEVLRRTPPTNDGMDDDEDARLQYSTTSAVTSSILSSLRSLFLQNVLYPSILECSDGDGSAVAVLTYLDAMLGVVDEGTKLESAILGFLMGQEDTHRSQQLGMSSSTPLNRKKSSALVLLESGTPRSTAPATPYFSSLGRFSLKDLIVTNVHSTSQPTSTAALKLLQTILTRHDRWSMGLLDVVGDDGATSFPTALREEGSEEGEDEEEEEEGEVSDEDSDVFVYPADEDESPAPSGSTPMAKGALDSSTPSRLLLGRPIPSTPTIKTHYDSLDTLLSLISSIDPSYRKVRAIGGESEILSTGFANYLVDAEVSMSSDLGFKRGLSISAVPDRPVYERRRSTSGRGAPGMSDFDEVTMYKHNLRTTSKLLSLILDSLAHFFSHSPDHNLALTAVLASLTLCPYRSLEGWMLPSSPVDESAPFIRISKGERERSLDSDDGEDRSVDGDIDELSRHDALLSSSPPPYDRPGEDDEASCLMSILSALATSVDHYRHSIPGFDVYLSERRQGLMFVENLADALDLNEGDGNAFGEAVKALSVSPSTPTPSTPRQSTFGAFLSPRPSQTAPDPYTTPPRARTASSTSQTPTIGGIGSASPFAVHYRETGSIIVQPLIVPSPSHPRHTTNDTHDGPPDSPTKRLSSLPPSSSVSEMSDSGAEEREVKDVSLSTILDNTIVLEEFIKELAAILYVRSSLGIDVRRFF